MRLAATCSLLLGFGAGCLAATPGEPLGLYRGTAHDALYDLCLHGQRGVAVGSAGLLVMSNDGGEHWQPAPAFTESALLDVSCGDGPELIVAQEGRIFRRIEGRYESVPSGTEARLLGVDSNAGGLAVAVGAFGTVLRSKDGGASWETLFFDWEAILNDFLEPHLYAVDVSPQGVITLVGEFELVVRSPDGGDSWETVHKGEASLFGLDLRADGIGYAVGQDGRVIGTGDGGLSWSVLDTASESNLLDVWSAADGEVLVSGIRQVLRSADGGQSWSPLEVGDFNVGWYLGLSPTAGDDGSASDLLLAGHGGNIIKLQLK